MALGDGIRRNMRTIGASERERFVNALLVLQGSLPGRSGAGGGGDLSGPAWLSLENLHRAGHAPQGPQFVPWLRELCNRFEQLLREIDPLLSLHYWDWNENPHELFTSVFVRQHEDTASRSDGVGQAGGAEDTAIIAAPSFERMRQLLQARHEEAHAAYFGRTGGHARRSPHAAFAFLLHANADRLFAMWQARRGHAWRLDPALVYGTEGASLASTLVDPWTLERLSRPWAARDDLPRTFTHRSVVAPPCYDSLPRTVRVDEVSNPGQTIAFDDVYTGQTFASAACFQVLGAGNVTFRVTHGPTSPYSLITPCGTITIGHTPMLYQEARLWFGFTGGPPRTLAPAGAVTIRCEETAQEFVFTLRGNSIAPPRLAPAGAHAAADAEGTRLPERAGVIWTCSWRPA